MFLRLVVLVDPSLIDLTEILYVREDQHEAVGDLFVPVLWHEVLALAMLQEHDHHGYYDGKAACDFQVRDNRGGE